MYICIYNELWEILCIFLMFSTSLFPPQLLLPQEAYPSAYLVIAQRGFLRSRMGQYHSAFASCLQ